MGDGTKDALAAALAADRAEVVAAPDPTPPQADPRVVELAALIVKRWHSVQDGHYSVIAAEVALEYFTSTN